MLMVFSNEGNTDLQPSSITADLKEAVDNGTFSALGDIDTSSITAEKYVGELRQVIRSIAITYSNISDQSCVDIYQ